MTCRDEILTCVEEIIRQNGMNEFTILDVINRMQQQGTLYPESTIRTHIASSMCKNAPANHLTRYADFERMDRGTYKLIVH